MLTGQGERYQWMMCILEVQTTTMTVNPRPCYMTSTTPNQPAFHFNCGQMFACKQKGLGMRLCVTLFHLWRIAVYGQDRLNTPSNKCSTWTKVSEKRGDHTDFSAQNITCGPVSTYYEAARRWQTYHHYHQKKIAYIQLVHVGLSQAHPNYVCKHGKSFKLKFLGKLQCHRHNYCPPTPILEPLWK